MFATHLSQVLLGEKATFGYKYTYADDKTVYREIILVPELNNSGETATILCLVDDITQRETAERNKRLALNDIEKLQKALDEHAIVAFTDAKGIITSVNNKFCEISQYSRAELIGKSHRLINSKYHLPSFFSNMWKTISRGKVWDGEICNRAKDGSLYWVHTTIVPFVNEAGKPTQYIAIRADITKRKLAEQEAKQFAYYDDLTSLPNRRLLKEKLENILNGSDSTANDINALLLIDLDNFKDVNDSLGHTAGDELLKQVAFRLQQQTKTTHTAVRLGGDEFVVLMAAVGETKHKASIIVAEHAEQIRAVLSELYIIDGLNVHTSPSIGIALFDNAEDDASELIKQADIAMYQSKNRGRNQVSFFDPKLQIELNNRTAMQRELAQAIHQSEFMLYYQPIFDVNKKVIGCEALIRWHNANLGMVSPAEFIPLAEQSDQIVEIGEWVLDIACHQLHLWSQDDDSANWTLAVNISARQFQHANFIASVHEAIKKYKTNPYLLKLEVTESMLQKNIEETINSMKELRKLGIRFSLDDFGTGFSSLNYLTKLPIDTLKIDSSFVNNMIHSQEDAAVVATILSLAFALKLEVVAEGVETQEQLTFLINSGCQNFQGYLLAKPVPAQEMGWATRKALDFI